MLWTSSDWKVILFWNADCWLTGGQFKFRQNEHSKEYESINKHYARFIRKQSENTVNKSAITEHTSNEAQTI